jgi:mono/diheme cytochrome c family protein
MKKRLKVVGALFVLVSLSGAASFFWASSKAQARLARTVETHRVDFPIPFPLTDAERAELGEGADPGQVALERARARGKHLVEARYVCAECHGKDFGGGTLVDDPAVGRLFGLNLTLGRGGVTAKYTAADWDRMVRHGVRPDGTPTPMPSSDFVAMSDQELSDIVAYLRSLPPVDRELPRPSYGPLMTLLLATGEVHLSADENDHHRTHAVMPPQANEGPEFGRHLVVVCNGCHGTELVGGPIVGAPPDWPPAANLTPHADGLAGWTFDDFQRALREGKAKDGRALRPPMAGLTVYAANITDTELKAMWAYLQTVPAKPDPGAR